MRITNDVLIGENMASKAVGQNAEKDSEPLEVGNEQVPQISVEELVKKMKRDKVKYVTIKKLF